MLPRVYFKAPNIQNDASMTITIIHDVLSHCFSNLPKVFYLQLGNICREKKLDCFWISKHAC